MSLDVPGRPSARHDWAGRMATRGAGSAAIGVVIAVCLWAISGRVFTTALVYSLCIALSCWLLIDGGRGLLAARLSVVRFGDRRSGGDWPGWVWMIGVVVAGGILGYAIGNEIANRLTGLDSPGPFNATARQFISLLVLALLPALTITYFFQSREVIAGQRAEVERAERQIAERQLKLLESQLEPHMLFNTLANLRALIAIDPPRAQAMLDRLIAFLRASLAGSRAATHPLEAEFGRLRDYLELMQIRMGGRLQTRFDLPAELTDEPVPPLLLQPLVENAIRHGLEPKREGGRIDVSAARQGGWLTLRVRDTGLGLAASAVGAGSASIADRQATSPEDGGFGLAHVRERLATLHGGTASFTIEGADDDDGGTVATIRIPCVDSR